MRLINFKNGVYYMILECILGHKKSPFKKVKGQNIWSHTMSC